MPPSVTLSWRSGRVTSDTLASGSTLAVSTSFSCSIQARTPDSSPARVPSSSPGTLRRASRAMRATVSLSSDINPAPKPLNGAVGSRFARPCHPEPLARPPASIVLPQQLAHRAALILGAHQSAALQLGHDEVDELLDRARAVDRRQHEAVAARLREEGLHLVGDGFHRADEL